MQLQRLNELIREVRNRPFYRERKLCDRYPLESLDDLSSLPLLTKEQVLGEAAGHPAIHLPLVPIGVSLLPGVVR